ncbi:MAG TPA: 23S rRNA (guanosine(2251)-2'-O)-methyltransferase RlmB [Nevskiales bacterium]|nr:23S rRNA (guanosine(2251)-2'-O)-methyltransferase RlmB [Nevskiales bacterium]
MAEEAGLVAGWHAVFAALRGGAARQVWLRRGREDRRSAELQALARERGVPLQLVEGSELDRRAPDVNHQGVLAQVNAGRALGEPDLEALLDGLGHAPFLLVLDGVQDPHNLGACLRTADAAGVDAVIAPRDRAVGLTPVARKAAAGAAEVLPFIQVTNLARSLRELQQRGIWVIGAAGEAGQSLYQTDLKGPLALVLGAEEKGLRRLTREHCDLLVRIPMRGSVESLNVSVAAAVCLYEALRQRG